MGALIKAETGSAAVMQRPEAGQYLTFVLAGEMFAIGILRVKEIIEYGGLTTVPMMPACIRGVINLRGAVVPVIDLASRFGRGAAQIGRRTCIVIAEVGAQSEEEEERHVVGVIVDAVSEVVEIPAAQIEPAPTFGARLRTDFIQGMARRDHGFVILLEVDKVLSIDDLAALGTVIEQQEESAAA